ncbi:MAG: hypothetical protein ACHRHE_04825 [Tepidisphaerales bacterium]
MKAAATPVFVLQNLESRMLLCGGTVTPAAEPVVAALTAVATGPHFTKAFSMSGTYSIAMVVADVGKKYIFKGSGKPAGFGTMQLSGWVQTPGYVASGKARGVLVLKNSQGTIELSLSGPTEPGFGPLPTTLSYHITGGTGAYTKAYGSGTIADQLTVTPAHFVFRF